MIANNELMQTLEAIRQVAAQQGSDVDTIFRCVLLGVLNEMSERLTAIPDALHDSAAPPEDLNRLGEQLHGQRDLVAHHSGRLREQDEQLVGHEARLDSLEEILRDHDRRLAALEKSAHELMVLLQTHAELHENKDPTS